MKGKVIMPQQITDKPVRVELYDNVMQAERSREKPARRRVQERRNRRRLLTKVRRSASSRRCRTWPSPGRRPEQSAAAGGAIGAGIGGAALALASLLTAGRPC